MHLTLLAMASDTGLVLTRHRQAAGRFHQVQSMGVMALHTVHLTLRHRMMIWEVELRLRLEMALVAGWGIVSGVRDKLTATPAAFDVEASGAVAGFTAVQRALGVLADLDPCVTAQRKAA
jgi:hypothetical protein